MDSNYLFWSPQVVPTFLTVLILWTQERMTGAFFSYHCFLRSFLFNLTSKTPGGKHMPLDKTTYCSSFLSFPHLSVKQLTEAFTTWLMVYLHLYSCQHSWWLQQVCRWSIQQPVLSEPGPLCLECCLHSIHLNHLLTVCFRPRHDI